MMIDEVKKAFEEYHTYRTNVEIMKITVPFVIIVLLAIVLFLGVPVVRKWYQIKEEKKELVQENQQLEKENAEAEKENAALYNANEQLYTENTYLKDSIVEIDIALQELSEENKALEASKNGLEAEVNELMAENNNLKEENDELEVALLDMEKEKKDLKVALEEANNTINYYTKFHSSQEENGSRSIFTDFSTSMKDRSADDEAGHESVNVSPSRQEQERAEKAVWARGTMLAILCGLFAGALAYVLIWFRRNRRLQVAF